MSNNQTPIQKIFQNVLPRSIGSSAISLVARQPIFDKGGNIKAYELLFRDPELAAMNAGSNSHAATSTVMIDGFNLLRPTLRPGQRFFINMTEELLVSDIPSILPPNICTLEILETALPTKRLIQSLKKLKLAGYSLALDDYTGQITLRALLPLVDIIKVDVLELNESQLRLLVDDLSKYPAKLLAEKVEDAEMETLCKSLGFSLFQGFFFRKPEIVTGKKITSSQTTKMRLLSLSSNENADVREVTNVIQADVSLTLKLLSYINSLYFGLPVTVTSIHHAIMLLGKEKIMQWLYAATLADIDAVPMSREVAHISAFRAKFLENLAILYLKTPNTKNNLSSQLFLVGLFSLLEKIMQIPFSDIASLVPMDDDVLAALQKKGKLSKWLCLVEAYERGNWYETKKISQTLHLEDKELTHAYTDAVFWSNALYGA